MSSQSRIWGLGSAILQAVHVPTRSLAVWLDEYWPILDPIIVSAANSHTFVWKRDGYIGTYLTAYLTPPLTVAVNLAISREMRNPPG